MIANGYNHALSRLAILLVGCAVMTPASSSAKEKKREPAFGGYCLISYFDKGQAVKGDPAHQSEYVGELYYFSSADAKKKFEKTPHIFMPRFGGLCTMALGGPYGNRLPSDPTVFAMFRDHLYMFSSERAKRLWEETPNTVIERAHKLFEQPRLGGYCPVSYQRSEKPAKGNSSLRSVYMTYVYYMESREAFLAFNKDPEKYLPPYWNWCATNMANHTMKLFAPTIFRVVRGKTYFFHDEAARKQFDANPDEIIKKADAHWASLQPK